MTDMPDTSKRPEKKAGKLNARGCELKVLRRLSKEPFYDGPYYLPFAPIARDTKLTRAEVRRTCRSLARKGLAQFRRGLWTEDGTPAGSGYAITESGRSALKEGEI